MRESSPSASLLLPFGALMGAIPIDAISRGRVLGDFSSAIDSNRFTAGRPATPVVAGSRPVSAALSPSLVPSGDGGIRSISPEAEVTGG